ncbi:AAA family ATPase [Polyangium jinanense]|uniref:AAA family ATPase n=1 Tax=Polyangium jinanense TaxID=2829994 RepID=A0A9X4AYQ0_9BACT|nr:ATP-binding protein [Polyangium jinanense]MDC3960337.1 AAA family ATPase [Polyangium jinanense]MDC3987500.1 AAA family ATPase [Polyangium jinanense]
MNPRATPSLRISRLVVQNFRTFHGPTEIPLAPAGGAADEVAVFHGGNGSGKSNALAALELFFRAAIFWLRSRANEKSSTITRGWNSAEATSLLFVSPRDWPPGIRAPMRIEVHFSHRDRPITVELIQAGNEFQLILAGVRFEVESLSTVRTQLESPLGTGSQPFFRLDARRREARFYSGFEQQNRPPRTNAPDSPLSTDLATRLLDLATSLDPLDTERWRAFTQLLSRFETLKGREVNILRLPDGSADLRFEIRGKQILRVSELSSGEQQVVALCAAVLTSRAAIVAIEEPEISLDPSYQELLRDLLREQVRSGLVDQIILESHVPIFDGPEVVRFSRSPEGVTSVVRQPSDLVGADLRERARARGAEDQWVTPEGYTKLPKLMLDNLGLQAGGHLWFLRSEEKGRWEAWTAPELDQMFGFPGTDETK